jgi:hypothetical protein
MLIRSAVACATVIACVAVAYVVLGISTSAEAEKTLHAINLTTVVVERFVDQEGRWPQSWNELRLVTAASAPSMYEWPKHAKELSTYVTIDFQAKLDEVAASSTDDFDAILPVGAHYSYRDRGYVKTLIDTAEEKASN